jgi:hypothetical protein
MRAGHGKLPILGRVTEETSIPELADAEIEPETLVEAEATLSKRESKQPVILKRVESDLIKLTKENESPVGNGKQPQSKDETMKEIHI